MTGERMTAANPLNGFEYEDLPFDRLAGEFVPSRVCIEERHPLCGWNYWLGWECRCPCHEEAFDAFERRGINSAYGLGVDG